MGALQKHASGRGIFSAAHCNHLEHAANGLVASNYRVPVEDALIEPNGLSAISIGLSAAIPSGAPVSRRFFFEMDLSPGLCIKRCTQPFLLSSLKNIRYYNHGSTNVETCINQWKKKRHHIAIHLVY
jgi:hypothetical protein